MDAVRVTLLGTGTSTGVPVIGCPCRVCTSDDPRDTRLRCSAHVEVSTPEGPVHIQIDVGPDFRQQALTHDVRRIDAVLITHHHFDHVTGLDDLRPYFFDNRAHIPILTSDATAAVLERSVPYLFREDSYPGVARLEIERVQERFEVVSRYTEASVPVVPIEALHGDMPVLGFRIGAFAYLTDVNHIPPESYPALEDLDVLVLDALRREPHATHFTLEDATSVARRVGAKQAYFVHMTHSVLHAEEDALLPDGVALAYDGLQFTTRGSLPGGW